MKKSSVDIAIQTELEHQQPETKSETLPLRFRKTFGNLFSCSKKLKNVKEDDEGIGLGPLPEDRESDFDQIIVKEENESDLDEESDGKRTPSPISITDDTNACEDEVELNKDEREPLLDQMEEIVQGDIRTIIKSVTVETHIPPGDKS